jgi:hypothetical protein
MGCRRSGSPQLQRSRGGTSPGSNGDWKIRLLRCWSVLLPRFPFRWRSSLSPLANQKRPQHRFAGDVRESLPWASARYGRGSRRRQPEYDPGSRSRTRTDTWSRFVADARGASIGLPAAGTARDRCGTLSGLRAQEGSCRRGAAAQGCGKEVGAVHSNRVAVLRCYSIGCATSCRCRCGSVMPYSLIASLIAASASGASTLPRYWPLARGRA